MNSMNEQPTERVANGVGSGSASAQSSMRSADASLEATRAIPVRQVVSCSPAQSFSSQSTIASHPVARAEKTARMSAQPATGGGYVRDPFEPSTPDPATFPQQSCAPGSTAPVATRYSESSRMKKKQPLAVIFIGAVVALAACAFVLFHTSGTAGSAVTPGGGVTQAQRSEAESGESSFKTPGVQQNAATLTVDTSDLFNVMSNHDVQGEGKINRSEKINMTMAAVVTQVLPNANLVIEGTQEIRVNYELRQLTVRGIIRRADIKSDNTIESSKIAELRVSYGGRGTVSDMQEPRYGRQLLDILSPF